MSTIVDSFGQTFPHVQFHENNHHRSPSNVQQLNTNLNGVATINNGKLKSLTPPQMYELDTPVNEDYNGGSAALNTSPNKVPATTNGRSNANGVANAYAMDAFTRKKGLPWVLASQMFLIFILLFVIAFLIYKMYLFEEYNKEDKLNLQNNNCLPLPNLEINPQKIELKSKSLEGHFKKAAVVSDNVICSELGRNVLLRGGNAVDAAISVSFCIGALNFPSAGLGGGFLMTFFRRFDGKCITIDALETIPPLGNNDTINPIEGYKSVSIPGVLHGLWTAYKRFGSGKITWNNLIMPTVHLLNEGFPASQALEKLSKKYSDKFNNETNKEIRNLFLNPTNGHHFREGQIIRNPLLAETYKKLALTNDPINLFYGNNGAIAKQIVEEFNQNGGLITHKDLQSYRSVIDEPYLNNFSDQKLVFCGPKTSSEFIENIIQKLENNSSEFGIPSKEEIQVDKEIGSSHITIVDSDGNTISMTHSINSPFGSLRRSPFLGILWNNQLINLNNSTDINLNNNQIGINNRLISSLSPISVYDRESRKIKLAIGASGGNELEAISSLSQVLTQIISFNKTLKEAIDMPRLFKNEFGIFYETGFPMKIIENLQNKGHKIKEMDYSSSLSLNGILREETDNILSAVNDYRLEDNNYPAGY